MTISQVAQKYNVSQDTLRYYEKIGLIPPVPRNAAGKRDYDKETLGYVETMTCLRAAGVQIEALVEYVKLCRTPGDTSKARRDILIEQRKRLAERIVEMQESLDLLDYKINYYADCLNKKKK